MLKETILNMINYIKLTYYYFEKVLFISGRTVYFSTFGDEARCPTVWKTAFIIRLLIPKCGVSVFKIHEAL